MKESDIEAAVCAYAEKHEVLVRKFVSPGHRGVPDRLFIFPWGETVYVEFKSRQGSLNSMQLREHRALRDQRARVAVVSSVEMGQTFVDILFSENSLEC